MEKGKEEYLDFRVLYVEDEDDIRDGIVEMLKRRMPDLHVASNGFEGLEIFREVLPDIVITDIRMPKMTGLEMAREIKKIKPNIQIIVTSAYSDINYFIDSIDIGINQYVLKPITRERLFMAIEKAAHVVGLQKQVERQMDTIIKLHSAIDQSQSIIEIANAEGTIEYVNKRYEEVTGFSLKEAQKLGLKIFQLSGDLQIVEADIKEKVLAGKIWKGEYQTMRRNGEKYWEYASITPIKDANGVPVSFVKVAEDISELRKVTEALVQSEQKHRSLIENLGEGIGIIDLTFEFVFANPALKEIFANDDLEESSIVEYVDKATIIHIKEQVKNLQKGEKKQFEFYIKAIDNKIKNLNVTITPQFDNNLLSVNGYFCIFNDVSPVKELIEQLQQARDTAQQAFQTIEEKNLELHDTNQKLIDSEKKLSELNEILIEYIKATGK